MKETSIPKHVKPKVNICLEKHKIITRFSIYYQERISTRNECLIKAKRTKSIYENTVRNSEVNSILNIFP